MSQARLSCCKPRRARLSQASQAATYCPGLSFGNARPWYANTDRVIWLDLDNLCGDDWQWVPFGDRESDALAGDVCGEDAERTDGGLPLLRVNRVVAVRVRERKELEWVRLCCERVKGDAGRVDEDLIN